MCDEAKERMSWNYPPYSFSPNRKEKNLTHIQTGAVLQDQQHLNLSASLRSN
jgi:hypothetical protein